MGDNLQNETTPELKIDPTVVDKSQEAERGSNEEVVPKKQYDDLRSYQDRRHATHLDQFAKLAKNNPELLKDMDGSTEDGKKFRDSVVKRIYPEYETYEQAMEYIDGVQDPKVEIDARIGNENIRLDAYLDAVAEFNPTYAEEGARAKFKEAFRSYVTTLPYATRLLKTKKEMGLVNGSDSISTPVGGGTPPVPIVEKTEMEKKQEVYDDNYQKIKHLIR